MTNAVCLYHCLGKGTPLVHAAPSMRPPHGHEAAVVESAVTGTDCYCLAELSAAATPASPALCTTPCAGDFFGHNCGGPDHALVLRTGSSSFN